MLVLRDYQERVVAETRQHFMRGIKKVLIVVPTGGGKTVIAAFMLQNAEKKGMRSNFLMHRRELIKQTCETLAKHDTNFGVIAAGFIEEGEPLIQVGSIGSVARRLDRLEEPAMILWDEAHHIVAGTWDKIYKRYPNAYHILLTATPERLDGKGLEDYADVMVEGPTTKWLIENGHLANYAAYGPSSVSMEGVHTKRGDYDKKETVELIDKPTITGSAVTEYLQKAKGKKAVVFAITVEHSQNIVAEFNAKGVRAVHIDGTTPVKMRDFLLREFREGKYDVVSNVDLFGEGFDLPSLVCLIMLRPTQSLSFFLQMCGRPLRFEPGKTAIILDLVGNIERHGLPCEERKWTLQGRVKKKRKNDGVAPVKICEQCFAAQPVGKKECMYCGAKFKVTQREITEVEGVLNEIDKEKFKKRQRREQGRQQTLEELREFGRKKGYKPGWAEHVFKSRQAKRVSK